MTGPKINSQKKSVLPATPQYTCNDYRQEMILLGLRRQLERQGLTTKKKAELIREITRLEEGIGF